MQVDMIEETFLDSWGQYSAIVNYAEATKTNSRELKHACQKKTMKVCFVLYIFWGGGPTRFSQVPMSCG